MPLKTLKRHVTGKAMEREGRLSPPETHQLRVARSSMRMHCAGVLIMGGPNHRASARIIERLTGQIVGIDADCTCTD